MLVLTEGQRPRTVSGQYPHILKWGVGHSIQYYKKNSPKPVWWPFGHPIPQEYARSYPLEYEGYGEWYLTHVWGILKAQAGDWPAFNGGNQHNIIDYILGIQNLTGQGCVQVSHGPEVDLWKGARLGLSEALRERLHAGWSNPNR